MTIPSERPYRDGQLIRDIYQRRAVGRLYARYCKLSGCKVIKGVRWSEGARGWCGDNELFLGATVADVLAWLYLQVEKLKAKTVQPWARRD